MVKYMTMNVQVMVMMKVVIEMMSLRNNFKPFYFFYEEILHTKTHINKPKYEEKKHVSKHALKKRLTRKSFIHLSAFCAF